MSFNRFLEKSITASQRCQRNWDLDRQVPEEDIKTMKISVTECSSKQNRVVISNMINGWEFEIASGIVIMLILLLYYFIAKNNKASNRNSKIKFRTPPKTKKPGKDKEKR